MQNYATFNLVINLESNNNNELLHVVIISVNLVFSERERKEERKGEREEKRMPLLKGHLESFAPLR